MGEFTDDVHAALRDALASHDTARDWRTEWYADRTPVDVAGVPGDDSPLVFVEVEMRRADPANNPVKLARHAADGEFDAPVLLVQVFSGYYDLDSGGVSSKRENATFVGCLAEESVDGFDYHAVDLRFTPPKRGRREPENWRDAVEDVAGEIAELL
ncbi:hypothetical protein [Halobacterium zhouii]|uniref:hypothetical protein n=1 Tax=Halobacterium zhouii TaxID=2902624 RepID=UPI001E3D28B5|nr:hypothetical protein [Halobacterium zhouii]